MDFIQKLNDMSERRMEICRSCEHFSNDSLNKCKKCGCLMQLKTRIPAAVCPINRWNKETLT